MKDILEPREVWIRAVEAYISSSNSTSKEVAIGWADFVVNEYKKRFVLEAKETKQ